MSSKSVSLGAVDATGEANLAAHRCSNSFEGEEDCAHSQSSALVSPGLTTSTRPLAERSGDAANQTSARSPEDIHFIEEVSPSNVRRSRA